MEDEKKNGMQLIGKWNELSGNVENKAKNDEEGKESREKIKKNIERYRTLVEDMPSLVCRFQPDGTLTFVNGSYCKFFGTTREALVGEGRIGRFISSSIVIARWKVHAIRIQQKGIRSWPS